MRSDAVSLIRSSWTSNVGIDAAAHRQVNGPFMGDYIGVDATPTTACPIWSDTRTVDEFLCPGTGTSRPPQVCV